MWLYTPFGFISVVQHREHEDMLLVRARTEAHLTAVLAAYLPTNPYEIEHTPKADYAWRTTLHRKEFAELLANAVADIVYDNFKHAAAAKKPYDEPYMECLHDTWMHARDMQHDEPFGGQE